MAGSVETNNNSPNTETGVAKLEGFYGAVPIAQRVGSSQAAVTTTAATSTTPYGFSTTTQANAIVTLVNEIRATLVALGLMKGSA